jgi:hypothetical protein
MTAQFSKKKPPVDVEGEPRAPQDLDIELSLLGGFAMPRELSGAYG